MANQVLGNPWVIDTAGAGAVKAGQANVRQIQWVDDNADIPDNGNLIMSINGQTIEATVQRHTTDSPGGEGAVLWSMGPFNPGLRMNDIKVTTLSAGNVIIWVD